MTEVSNTRTVRVRIVLPRDEHLPQSAVVRVRVDDVTAADRPAEPLVEDAVTVAEAGEAPIVLLKVRADQVDPRRSYSVFAHVDVSGTGRIETGDYISPASHPVLTHGAPDDVGVAVIQI